MTNQKKQSTKKDDDAQSYLAVAIVFFVAGLGLMVSDGTRATGIPFLVLGATLFAISRQQPTKPKK